MNWDALAAIAETVGAIAVIVTIGYLALQIRQNTRTMRAAAFQQFIEEQILPGDRGARYPTLRFDVVTAVQQRR